MKSLNAINCIVAALVSGCLTLVAVVLGVLFLTSGNLSFFEIPSPSKNDLEKHTNSTHLTHTTPKEKDLLFKVLLISDSESDYENIKKALPEGHESDFDALFHLGDITHLGVLDDFALYTSIIEEIGINAYSVPGDRDLWKAGGVKLYEEYFGNSYQMVELGNTRLLLIDNSDEYAGISDEQWQFIVKELNSADFVFLHNPLHKSKSLLLGSKGMGDYSENVDKQRIGLLSQIREGSVKAVFAGDQHIFSESADEQKKDLYHYVVGSISSVKAIGRPSFVILSIYEDGDYYVQKVTL